MPLSTSSDHNIVDVDVDVEVTKFHPVLVFVWFADADVDVDVDSLPTLFGEYDTRKCPGI